VTCVRKITESEDRAGVGIALLHACTCMPAYDLAFLFFSNPI
jgi:hypothetical protein